MDATENEDTAAVQTFVGGSRYSGIIAPRGKHPMPKQIAEAVISVMDKVGYVQKKGENKFHNYKFAAVGDLLAKIQPAMVEAGLVIVQDEVSHGIVDDSVCEAVYEFSLSTKEGVTWEERPRHTGWSTLRNNKGGIDDKALNKCYTAGGKYFLIGLFKIPTGDTTDPDEQEDQGPGPSRATTTSRAPTQVGRGASRPATAPPPASTPPAGQSQKLTNGDTDADWDVWIAGFKTEFNQQTNYTDARAICGAYKVVVDNMKEVAPAKYQALQAWVTEGLAALPKVGG